MTLSFRYAVLGRPWDPEMGNSVVSSVVCGRAAGLESPNDNEALSPLLEVVHNLEAEEREMKEVARERGAGQDNLNLKESSYPAVHPNSEAGRQFDNRTSGLDVVSLASTLASDLAHLVETMNLADRPLPPPATGNANMNRNGRPITARTMVPDNGRFSKLDFTASDLSAELFLRQSGVHAHPAPNMRHVLHPHPAPQQTDTGCGEGS